MGDFNQKNIIILSAVAQPSEFEPPLRSTGKNIFSKKYNFAYSVRPIYYFARVFGLFPFTIEHDSYGDIKEARVKIIDFLWFLFAICIYLFLGFYCFKNLEFPKDPNESYVLILGDYTLLILGLVSGAAMIISDMYNRNKIINILKDFTIFDKKVSFKFAISL